MEATQTSQTLHYIQIGDPSQQNLVLLHPLWVFSNFYEPLIPFLTDRFHVTIFDLPGFGNSPALEGEYTVEAIADSVKSMFLSLRIQKPVVLGSSLGALIAMVLAKDTELDIVGLALHAPPWDQNAIHLNFAKKLLSILSQSDVAVSLSNKILREEKFREILIDLAEILNTSSFVLEVKYNFLSEMLHHVNLEICNQIWRSLPQFEAGLYAPEIKVPTFLFISEKDGTVIPSSILELAKQIENAETQMLLEGGHALPIEYPEDVAQAFLDFCERHQLV